MRDTLAVILVVLLTGAAWANDPDPVQLAFFEKTIRPILANHCYHCHSADTKPAGDLRVDDRNGLLMGGKSGPAIVVGKSDQSLLIRRVTRGAKARMPAQGDPLTEEEIAALSRWINDGAVWPAVKVPVSLGQPRPHYEELKKNHWAWQPLTRPDPPPVADSAWPSDPIDRFILAKLESKHLKPTADADRRTLIRRLTYDLTGLPATPAEIDAFVADTATDATAQLVDRLLASPRFGEQWGRHWLDVARYGESTGPSRNIPYPHAWKYRDHVMESINRDVPYNRFIQEQIAGDLLPAQDDAEKNRLRIATGFLALGVKDVNQRFKVRFQMDNVDEQIDAVTRSILGLTVSCARCHDHKFDPVPQSDYYALAGIFTSTDNAAGVRSLMGGGGLDYYAPANLILLAGNLPPPPPEKLEKLKKELAEAKKAWDAIRGTPEGLKLAADGYPVQRPYRLKYEKLVNEFKNLADPAEAGLATHGVREAKTIGDTPLRIRGEAEKLGPTIPRGFLTAFSVPETPTIRPSASGRLELANWLTHPGNPLTARVAVNRIWAHLFGRGLVSTVDNFGVTGAPPTHPELLDYLASRFIAEGWSTKKLIRTLVLTRAYRLSAEATEGHRQSDPANTLLWRHTPRRLTAEEIRDSLLAVAGRLQLQSPGPSPVSQLKMIELRDSSNEAKKIMDRADASQHRSVYLPLIRGLTPHQLEPFDPVEQTLVTGSREKTTVPSQALFLLNAPFVLHQAQVVSDSLRAGSISESERIVNAYRRVLGRYPSDSESSRVSRFLECYRATMKPEDIPVDSPVRSKPGSKFDPAPPAWQAFVQGLLGSAEFRTVP